MTTRPNFQIREESRGTHVADYGPLVVLLGVSLTAGLAASLPHAMDMTIFMHFFMGFLLCNFAMLKLFHPQAFANGFVMYDLIGKRFRPYAYVYPYIELFLGLGYLSFAFPYLIYVLTIVVLGVGAAGVVSALRRGLDINCPCMGTVLKVPLSTVTLSEDLLMIVMAIALISMRAGLVG